MAPSNQTELVKMIKISSIINDRPSAFRYPRGSGNIIDYKDMNEIEIGKGYIAVEGEDLAILNLGTKLDICLEACKILKKNNINPTIADARFAKPLDTKLIDLLIENHKFLITMEEGSIGGFASHVLNYIHNVRRKNSSAIINNIFFPDKFIDHMTSEEQYQEIDMDVNSIIQKIKSLYDDKVIDITNFNFNNKF